MATTTGRQPQVHSATNEAPVASRCTTCRDLHLIEPNSTSCSSPSSSSRGSLQELSAGQIHNQGLAGDSPQQYQNQRLFLRPWPAKTPPSSFRRARQSSTEPESFEPLEVVEEEESIVSGASMIANSNHSSDEQSPEGLSPPHFLTPSSTYT